MNSSLVFSGNVKWGNFLEQDSNCHPVACTREMVEFLCKTFTPNEKYEFFSNLENTYLLEANWYHDREFNKTLKYDLCVPLESINKKLITKRSEVNHYAFVGYLVGTREAGIFKFTREKIFIPVQPSVLNRIKQEIVYSNKNAVKKHVDKLLSNPLLSGFNFVNLIGNDCLGTIPIQPIDRVQVFMKFLEILYSQKDQKEKTFYHNLGHMLERIQDLHIFCTVPSHEPVGFVLGNLGESDSFEFIFFDVLVRGKTFGEIMLYFMEQWYTPLPMPVSKDAIGYWHSVGIVENMIEHFKSKNCTYNDFEKIMKNRLLWRIDFIPTREEFEKYQ